MHLDAIRDLFHARAFALGLAYGGVAVLLAAVVATIARRKIPDFAGVLFVAAAWVAVRGSWGSTLAAGSVAVALALLAAGGALVVVIAHRVAAAAKHPLVVTAIALAPGAIELARVTPLAGSSLSRAVLALTTIGFGVLIRDFDAIRGPRGAPWLLFAVTSAGVYLAVPDTELARVLLGVAVPFVLLSVPRPLCPIGPAASAALAGLFCWVVFVGGRGRPGSVVGGLAAIGILVAEPIGRRTFGAIPRPLDRRDRNQDEWLTAAAVAAIAQFVIALYASRVIAREDSVGIAFAVFVPLLAVGVIAAPMLYPPKGPERPPHAHPRSRRPARSRH